MHRSGDSAVTIPMHDFWLFLAGWVSGWLALALVLISGAIAVNQDAIAEIDSGRIKTSRPLRRDAAFAIQG